MVLKILSRTLDSLLSNIISNSQSAFVKGSLLVKNVLLETEMVQGFNRRTSSPRGLLKVDLGKASDSVSWEFLIKFMEVGEFPLCI